jgi:ABC-type sugar transport system permease subunit
MMKKLMMFFALMFVLILPTFGQVVEPPTSWLALFANINVWLASLGGVAAVTVFLAAFLNTILKTKGFVKQIVAWVVAILLLVIGNLVNMGFMAELNWMHTIVYGVAAGFLANGIFDIETIKAILRALKIEKEV